MHKGQCLFFVLSLVTLFSTAAFADEPSYCNPTEFYKHEISGANGTINGIQRLHMYQLGKVKVAGLAVGASMTESVKALSDKYSSSDVREKYCTWYFNVGNHDAKMTFNWHYVPNPTHISPAEASQIFIKSLASSFDADSVSFVSCAERFNYLAMGCDEQRHRGPTAFGMMLAYSGCSPEHAAEIVNTLWGLNGIPAETRLAIIRAGGELGQSHQAGSQKLRALFEATVSQ
jgi:hypothetical protein